MCAFIPASANWSGAIPRLDRDWNSGSHACGVVLGSFRLASTAVEEQIGERDVEPLEEPRVLEDRAAEMGLDALRDGEVEPREAGDAVATRQRRRDRLHPREHLGDGRRAGPSPDDTRLSGRGGSGTVLPCGPKPISSLRGLRDGLDRGSRRRLPWRRRQGTGARGSAARVRRASDEARQEVGERRGRERGGDPRVLSRDRPRRQGHGRPDEGDEVRGLPGLPARAARYIGGGINLFRKHGLARGEAFRTWFDEELEGETFEVTKTPDGDDYRLKLIAVDATNRMLLVLPGRPVALSAPGRDEGDRPGRLPDRRTRRG